MDEESAFKRKMIIAAVVVALAIGGQAWWNRAHPPKSTANAGATTAKEAPLLGAKSVHEAMNFSYTAPDNAWAVADAQKLNSRALVNLVRANPGVVLTISAASSGNEELGETGQMAELTRAGVTSSLMHARFTKPGKHEVKGMEGLRYEVTATDNGKDIFGVVWVYAVNGYRYVLAAFGRATDQNAVSTQAGAAFRGFALIAPSRRASPEETMAWRDFRSRYGYRVEAKAPHWGRFGSLEEMLPGFEFGLLSKEQGALATFAIDLQGSNPGIDPLGEACLSLAGWRREDRRAAVAKELKAGAMTGTELSFEGRIDRVNFLYRHKLLRGSDLVYYAIAWVDKRHAAPDQFLADALAMVTIPNDEPATRPKLEEGELRERVLHGELMNRLGLHYHEARQYTPARSFFRLAFESKKNRGYLVNYFLSAVEMRQYDDALKYLDGYAAWLGEDIDFKARRAFLQARCGQTEAALKNYTAAFNAGYESDAMLVDYLKLLIHNDRADWAATKLEKYLREKDTLELRLAQSALLRQQRKFPEALAMLKEQEQRYSFSPALSHEFVACYYDAGRHKDALDECARLVAKGYDSAETHIAKARNELALKAYRQAKVSLEMALEKDPANTEAREYLRQIPGAEK